MNNFKDFKLAAVFSDGMVLQRGKPICVFGYGEDGGAVTVSFCGNVASAVIADNRWQAVLPPVSDYAEDLELTAVCGSETLTFCDIAIGEVWLAGGQSNMEMELHSIPQGREALENDDSPDIRYYYTQKNFIMDESFCADEADSGWDEWGTEWNRHWSAVAYFFAKRLTAQIAEQTGTAPVIGIIGCNWGATSASVWMSRESLLDNPQIKRVYIDEASLPELTEHEWCAPTTLYEPMVMRVCPYTLAGVIWYQGESDCSQADLYPALFTRLIELWRKDWNDPQLPFLFCQLAGLEFNDIPDWGRLREAQEKVSKTVPNTLMADLTDLGDFYDIHPPDKKSVGERLAVLAMRIYC
jgi:sialate O-acetylesterase